MTVYTEISFEKLPLSKESQAFSFDFAGLISFTIATFFLLPLELASIPFKYSYGFDSNKYAIYDSMAYFIEP